MKTRTEKHSFRIDSFNKRNAVLFLKELSTIVNGIPEDKRTDAIIIGDAFDDDEDHIGGFQVFLGVVYQRDSTPEEIEQDKWRLEAYKKDQEEKEKKELKRLLEKYPLTT